MRKFVKSLLVGVKKKNLPSPKVGVAESRRELIRQAVTHTVREYGEVLKRLGSE